MKIVRLKKQQIPFFAGLDPYGMLDRKELCADVVLGLTMEDGKRDLPAGLLIASSKGEHLVILWLFVAPAFRYKGCGEALLLAAFREAARMGKTKAGAVFSSEFGRETVCAGEKRFFTERLFNTGAKENIMVAELRDLFREDDTDLFLIAGTAGSLLADDREEADTKQKAMPARKKGAKDRVIPLGEIKKNKSLTGGAVPDSIVSVGSLELKVLCEGIKRCLSIHPCDCFEEAPQHRPLNWFDPEISCAVVEQGEVCGLFLLHPEENGRLWTEYLACTGAKEKDGVMHLLRFSAQAAVKHCKKGTEVVVRCHNKAVTTLVGKLFPEK